MGIEYCEKISCAHGSCHTFLKKDKNILKLYVILFQTKNRRKYTGVIFLFKYDVWFWTGMFLQITDQ